jgi:hypothetical protein
MGSCLYGKPRGPLAVFLPGQAKKRSFRPQAQTPGIPHVRSRPPVPLCQIETAVVKAAKRALAHVLDTRGSEHSVVFSRHSQQALGLGLNGRGVGYVRLLTSPRHRCALGGTGGRRWAGTCRLRIDQVRPCHSRGHCCLAGGLSCRGSAVLGVAERQFPPSLAVQVSSVLFFLASSGAAGEHGSEHRVEAQCFSPALVNSWTRGGARVCQQKQLWAPVQI